MVREEDIGCCMGSMEILVGRADLLGECSTDNQFIRPLQRGNRRWRTSAWSLWVRGISLSFTRRLGMQPAASGGENPGTGIVWAGGHRAVEALQSCNGCRLEGGCAGAEIEGLTRRELQRRLDFGLPCNGRRPGVRPKLQEGSPLLCPVAPTLTSSCYIVIEPPMIRLMKTREGGRWSSKASCGG